MYQNIDILRRHGPEHVLILAGDHVYKMNYGRMLADHVECRADFTMACIEVPRQAANSFGVVDADRERRVRGFIEKPAKPPALAGHPDRALASMGVYVARANFLYEQLIHDADAPGSTRDFGHDLIPYLMSSGAHVHAHDFTASCVNSGTEGPYWRDVGTVDAYWDANMELTKVVPELNLYDADWPIWTYHEQLPPAKFVFDDPDRRGHAIVSLVSSGCIVSGSVVRHSVLFSNVRVHDHSAVEHAVVLPQAEIGAEVHLRRVVIDKHCKIPPGTRIGFDAADDRRRFHVTPGGVTLVVPEMLGQRIHHHR